jgi:hypothetical protein
MNIRIDPEFKDYLGPLDEDAHRTLEASIQAEGCRDALVVWPQPDHGAILLDGHNRLEICERLGIAYSTVDCPDSVLDRADATAWIVENQRGRRNLTQDQLRYLCGKVYSAEKAEHGGDRKSNPEESSCKNCNLIPAKKTEEKVADEFGVSPRTVHNNARFASQVDAIAAKHGPQAKTEILAGRKDVSDFIPPEPKPSGKKVTSLASAPEPEEGTAAEAESVEESVSDGKPPEKDLRDMDETEAMLWAAKNLPITMDSGAKPGAVYFAEATSDNLADPEAARRYDDSAMKFIGLLDSHIAILPVAIKRENPDAERRELFRTRLSRHVDALQTIIETLGKEVV